MALSRRSGQRFQASIWPGFVDAMTALLLVLMFVLTIFMVVQSMLRDTITGQENELDALAAQVSELADALGLERAQSEVLEGRIVSLDLALSDARADALERTAIIASLTAQSNEQLAQIASFEAQVATLLSERNRARAEGDALRASLEDLEGVRDQLISEQEALQLALAKARDEIDAETEAARLAAAQADALQALVEDLRAQSAKDAQEIGLARAEVDDVNARLTAEESARLAEAAAAEALRKRLETADAELTAMSLALEEQRKSAEETLTLLAAANSARDGLDEKLAAALLASDVTQGELGSVRDTLNALAEQAEASAKTEEQLRREIAAALAEKALAQENATRTLSDAEIQAALLATANTALADAENISAERAREVALLNEQVATLRGQLGVLQEIIDTSTEQDEAAEVQLQALGSQLNAALARVAAEEKKRRELEEAERKRLEAEAQDLARYRSEFFGRLRELLGSQDGIQIEGDRFVFASEVLFQPGAATLSRAGQQEIAKIAGILRSISSEIPAEIDWVIRVDGHTDNIPLSGTGEFRDNWELSQARALSVVRYMVNFLGIPPARLTANGFGEYQPVNTANTVAARAQNRRIELKLTEK